MFTLLVRPFYIETLDLGEEFEVDVSLIALKIRLTSAPNFSPGYNICWSMTTMMMNKMTMINLDDFLMNTPVTVKLFSESGVLF